MLPLQPHQVQPFSIPLLQAPHGPFPPAVFPGPQGVHYAGRPAHAAAAAAAATRSAAAASYRLPRFSAAAAYTSALPAATTAAA